MRRYDKIKDYLIRDLAAAKIERNIARLQAKRLLWATVALAALAVVSMGLSAWLILWLIQQPTKPLFLV